MEQKKKKERENKSNGTLALEDKVFKRDKSPIPCPSVLHQTTFYSMAFMNTLDAINCSTMVVLNLPNTSTL